MSSTRADSGACVREQSAALRAELVRARRSIERWSGERPDEGALGPGDRGDAWLGGRWRLAGDAQRRAKR